ncbi:5392_t:CDS:2 [Scutellospora calospora]|uniref:5392_t:CDS:1 n=1 Tax=Scutellospora calospora TaxID=85575 RepID=A0ACA9L9H1_9GLOM|nr:5392_t:CDS:2 [Scutellospora calospora]
MPEVDDYFKEFNVNNWSYDGFFKFLTTENSFRRQRTFSGYSLASQLLAHQPGKKKSFTQNQDNDKHSLTAISESNKYPVRCRKKANHILNDYSPVCCHSF